MLIRVDALAGRFASDHLHILVVDERVEKANGVAPSAHAGQEVVGDASLLLGHLLPHLASDDALEFADHLGEGCGTHDRADDVVSVVHPSGPLAERLVDRVLEDPGTFLDGMDLGSEQLHPVDVERLPLDVVHSHEDLALESEVGRQRCGGDAVLSRAGLGDDSLLAHLLGEEALADHVVDLVRAGMVQVLPL